MKHNIFPSWIECTELFFGKHCFFIVLNTRVTSEEPFLTHLCMLRAELTELIGVFAYLLSSVLSGTLALWDTPTLTENSENPARGE